MKFAQKEISIYVRVRLSEYMEIGEGAGVVFKDLGAEYYNQFNKERKINAYLRKLQALGGKDRLPWNVNQYNFL